MSRKYPLTRSFGFAFKGILESTKKEPNFMIHLTMALLALVLAFFLKITTFEWIALILAIFFVLLAELVNTSIESMVNLLSPEKRDEARIAKDTASAAVLVAATASIIVGAFIFLPRIF